MSVLLETSVGDITIDLLVDKAPKCCENFLKLCKIKYYNYSPVYNVQKDFSFQTGDPIGPGSKDSDGGSSIWGVLDPSTPSKKSFVVDRGTEALRHDHRGLVSMACASVPDNPNVKLATSQFIITLGDNLDYLDGRAAIFGTVVEGFDTLEQINSAFTDESGRPLKDIRIRHTIVLDDPFDDPEGLVEPPSSPLPSAAQLATVRIADDEEIDENADQEALEKLRREREARAQALTLEMVGDLPFAEVKPPENVLFICKLNPVTEDDDLRLIFSRFGKILSCEIIRDKKTGDSLQYGFIEFENQKDCENAYFKMDGVLIDDHRIHVDFSQSVSRLSDVWRNATNDKRRQAHGGGFGGMANLEKKRQFRGEETAREREERVGNYGMVIDKDNGHRRNRSPSRSRSPPRRERRDRDRSRDRYRDRSRERHRDDRRRDGDRRRDRSRDRHRDDKRRDRSRDRHRDHRDRDGRDRRSHRSRERHRSDRDYDRRK